MENMECCKKQQNVDFFVWQTADFILQLATEEDGDKILENVKNVMVSFEQNGNDIDKDLSSEDVSIDPENDIINVHLSQEETGSFVAGQYVKVQVNILYNGGQRIPTCQALILAGNNIYEEVMS